MVKRIRTAFFARLTGRVMRASNLLLRNHLERTIKDPDGSVIERPLLGKRVPGVRCVPTRNRFEPCWLRQIGVRTATRDSSGTDWVTTRSDLS